MATDQSTTCFERKLMNINNKASRSPMQNLCGSLHAAVMQAPSKLRPLLIWSLHAHLCIVSNIKTLFIENVRALMKTMIVSILVVVQENHGLSLACF